MQEEEFTVELKKLLASQGKPTTPSDGVQVTQQTGGVKQEPTKAEPRQEILSNFGCLKKHELKVCDGSNITTAKSISRRCSRPQTINGGAIYATKLSRSAQ